MRVLKNKIRKVCSKCSNEFQANSNRTKFCDNCRKTLESTFCYCLCGCGKIISWEKMRLGIKFIKGHARRHKSNTTQHNQAISRSNKGRKHEGHVSWSKGLTKETDTRLLKFSKKMSKIAKDRKFGSWMFGKKPTLDAIEKNKKTRKKTAEQNGYYHSYDTKQKISKANSGKNNGFFGKHHTLEARSKISIASAKMLEKIDKRSKYKTGFFKSHKNNLKFYYRSSLELQVFESLEKFDDVIGYYVEPIRIPYLKDYIRNYVPDVLICLKNNCILIEIKPSVFIDTENNHLKFDAARKFCQQNKLDFAIVDELCVYKMKFACTCNEILSCFNFLYRYDSEATDVLYSSKIA
ncbi:MAG: NUMOD3 domain-containing DNA-binding protein [Candidatus Nanoarchaeia archaeon]|jgi:hypothetical protein|nr:NUMOD3 domain-containing DNA-binding protein [Candidatus Nanoarchaeia archaeon]